MNHQQSKNKNPLFDNPAVTGGFEDFTNSVILAQAEKPIFTIGEPPAAIANGDNFSEISLDRDTGSEMSPPPLDFTNNNLYSPLAEMEAFSSLPPIIDMQHRESSVDSNLNSLSAALAQLPNAASTVFSTFSNIIKGTAPPMASNVQTNDSLTINDPMAEAILAQPYCYGYPTEPEQITAPPPLFSPTDESIFKKVPTETQLDNNFRMGGLKKKTYAHIPGLSTNQQTTVSHNPAPVFNMPPMPPMPKPQPDLSNQYPPDYQPPPMIANYNTNYDKTDYKEPEKSNKFSFASLIPTQLLEKLPAASNLSNLFGGGSDTTSSYSTPQMMSNENFTVGASDNYMNQQFTSISHQQDQPQMTQGQQPPPPMNFFNPQQFKTSPFESTVAQSMEPPMTNTYQTIPLASSNMNQSNINASQVNLHQQQQHLPEPLKQDQCQPTFFNPMEASKINSGRTRLSRYKNPNLIEVSNKAPILIPPIANLFNQPTALPKTDQFFQQTPLHPLTIASEQRPPSNPSMGFPPDMSLVSQHNPVPPENAAFHPPPTAKSFPPQQVQPLVAANDNLNQMFSNAAPVIDSNPPPTAQSFPPQQVQPIVAASDNLNQMFSNATPVIDSNPPPTAQSFPPQQVQPLVAANDNLNQMFSNATPVIDSNPPPTAQSFPPQQVQPLVAANDNLNQMFSNATPVIDSNPPTATISNFFNPEISQQPAGSLFLTSDPVIEDMLPVVPPQSEDDSKAFTNIEEYGSEYNPNETLPSVRSDMSERFDTMSLSGRSGSYVGSNLSLFATSELDSTAAMPTQSSLVGEFLNKQQDTMNGINGSTSVKSLSSSAATASKTYRPVYKHWFYQNDELWIPFSMTDSLALDEALTSGKNVVPTDSGRFDVNMNNKLRNPVFWNNNPNEIRRCSWFYKDVDAKLLPFDEDYAITMESSYENACNTGIWCSQLQLTNPGEYFHIQDTTTMFYLKGGQSFVVKRGVDEFDIDDGEAEKVDHLMILVAGFEMCNLSDLADELRSKTKDFVQQNYSEASDCGLVGRIEVLPVVFQSEEFNLHNIIMKSVTLSNEVDMAHQFNGQMLKTLCYGNANYHQKILENLMESLIKLFSLFHEKSPHFDGKVSIASSGIDSLFVFDLLRNSELPFKVKSFFALGMPSGLLKTNVLNENLEAPKSCEKFFNISHPSDSLAQRFEPLINAAATKNPPKLIDEQQLTHEASTIDFTLPGDTSFESSSFSWNFKSDNYWHSDKLSLLLVREIYSEIKVDGMFC